MRAGGAHELLGGSGRGRAWVGRQPGRKRATFLLVVCAQHAGDVRVIFGVAVGFVIEEVTAQRVVARGGGGEQVREVGRHGGRRGRRWAAVGRGYRRVGSGEVESGERVAERRAWRLEEGPAKTAGEQRSMRSTSSVSEPEKQFRRPRLRSLFAEAGRPGLQLCHICTHSHQRRDRIARSAAFSLSLEVVLTAAVGGE